ncbi:MAG: lamin tail domain-containing protein, partial [Verrucomicrobiales bacterium]
SLVSGSNRISVEVHQSSNNSSDKVFGVQLDAKVQTSPGSPGQPFRNSDNQWIEIANRNASASVDLGGWRFTDGIDFEFPEGTTLAPDEHACIVRDPELFAAAYPGSRVLGTFSGSISRSGERLELIDAYKNPVDLVRFFDGGSWPDAADGGGSTLELRDLGADNASGGAWEASDESSETAWRTYTYSETAASSGGPDTQWREFNMGMLGSGEILIDDITVTGGGQRITDPGFDSPDSWRLRGNHRHSEIIDDPDAPGNKVLRLVATGPTEHMHNQVETTLTSAISNGQNYEISFRARWVSGSNQLHTRLYFNRCANVNVIDRPSDPGTPSAPNSRSAGNIGPTYSGLNHSPAVPDANEAVSVSIAADDPDGISSLTLFYSVNGNAFQSVPMGFNGGRYVGGIPGQAASSIVQFYISGSDSQAASSLFPPAGADSRALYKVDDGNAATNGQHNFRIVMTSDDVAFQHVSTEVMSNDRLGATVIDREGDIYYGCGVRLKSSERGRNNLNRVGYNVRFPADDLYRGAHESIAIDRSEGQQPGQRELLFDMMISNSGGVLSRYYDLVKVLAPNNSLTGSATFQMARYDGLFLDSQFEDGSDGKVYEYELIYHPTTDTDPNGDEGLKQPQPDSVRGTSIGSNAEDPELYRYFFLNKINREADDFAPIIAYNNLFAKSGADFEEGLEAVVDVDDWLRGMAYAVLTGTGDNAAAGSQHNGLYYAKPDGRIMFLPHDMDFSFQASRSIFQFQESGRLVPSNSARRRLYLGHLHDIISTTYNNSYMSIWTDHFAEIDPQQNWSTDLSYMTSRSNSVLSQINGNIAPVAFNITTNSPHSIAGATATITGDGWVNVREIRIAGSSSPLAVTWTDGNSWEALVPAAPGVSTVTIEAVDFSGNFIGSDTITIDNTTPFEPASAANLVISEIMYHPADPSPEE